MKIAWIQFDIQWEDPSANLEYLSKVLEDANPDFDLLVLPEMFDTGFAMQPSKLTSRNHERTIEWMKATAVKYNCAVMGSLIVHELGRYYNRVIFTNGEEIADYDKNHLFTLSGENMAYTAGDQVLDMHWKGFKIRPLVCYDLRFPEISRNTEDLSLLIYVASWPSTRSEHWKSLLKARAIENQCYVLGVNRLGTDGNGYSYNGMSGLYSFSGESIMQSDSNQAYFESEIQLEPLDLYREKLPFLADCKL